MLQIERTTWEDSSIPAAAGDTSDWKTMVADLVVVIPGAPVVFRDGEVVGGLPGFTATAREEFSCVVRMHVQVLTFSRRRRRILRLLIERKDGIKIGTRSKEKGKRKNQGLSPLVTDENDDAIGKAGGTTATQQTATI